MAQDPIQQEAIARIDVLRAEGKKLREIAEIIKSEFDIRISAEGVRRVLMRNRSQMYKYTSTQKRFGQSY